MSGTFILYKHENFSGNSHTVNLGDYDINTLHSFGGLDIHDDLSSLSWNVDANVLVTLYEHDDGTGRRYSFGPGTGSDNSTHGGDDFKDCVSSWRWTRLDEKISPVDGFNQISTIGKKFTFPGETIELENGHFQGVAHLNNQVLAISASCNGRAEVFIFKWPILIGQGVCVEISRMNAGTSTFDHAGGIQIVDNILAVGVEDFVDKKSSIVKFFDLNDPFNPINLDNLEIVRQSSEERRKTAGAVGLVKMADYYLLVVGSWNSDTLDFYKSRTDDLLELENRFELFASWHKDNISNQNLWIDDNWANYQSLNLVSYPNSELYLVGGHGRYLGKDWIDLYKVIIEASSIELVKVSKRHLTCNDGTSFLYAGGIIIDNCTLHAIATERDAHKITAANIFEGPIGLTPLEPISKFIVNKRSRETHSVDSPCAWVSLISRKNIMIIENENYRPANAKWCDHCFPARADG